MRAYEDRVDYYAVLNVTREATPNQIRLAYKTLVRSEHPDVKRGEYDSVRYKNILKAYSILKDIKTRTEYDNQTSSGGGFFKKNFSFRFAYESLIKGTYRFLNTMNLTFLNVHTGKNEKAHEDYYDRDYSYYISDKLLGMDTLEIVQRLHYSENKYVQISAIILLACKKDESLIKMLDDLYEHRDSNVRKAAIWATGKMGLIQSLRKLRSVNHLYTPEERFTLFKAFCYATGGKDKTVEAELDGLTQKNIDLEKPVAELKQIYRF